LVGREKRLRRGAPRGQTERVQEQRPVGKQTERQQQARAESLETRLPGECSKEANVQGQKSPSGRRNTLFAGSVAKIFSDV